MVQSVFVLSHFNIRSVARHEKLDSVTPLLLTPGISCCTDLLYLSLSPHGPQSLTVCFLFSPAAGISAIVEQEYEAKEAGELNLNRGAIIQNAVQQPNGLWEGSLAGKTGLFRESFVRFLDSDKDDGVVRR